MYICIMYVCKYIYTYKQKNLYEYTHKGYYAERQRAYSDVYSYTKMCFLEGIMR
jgi:hypothetical protein